MVIWKFLAVLKDKKILGNICFSEQISILQIQSFEHKGFFDWFEWHGQMAINAPIIWLLPVHLSKICEESLLNTECIVKSQEQSSLTAWCISDICYPVEVKFMNRFKENCRRLPFYGPNWTCLSHWFSHFWKLIRFLKLRRIWPLFSHQFSLTIKRCGFRKHQGMVSEGQIMHCPVGGYNTQPKNAREQFALSIAE